MIEIKGRALERFVNRATQAGVPLWRIRRSAANALTACVSIEGFYALRPLVRGTGLSVRILGKRGLPIGLARARGREALLFGWILVLALILAASRFIWRIDLDGCDVVREAQILKTLAELGVETGVPRTAASTYDLSGKIMASDARIAWAGVRLEGVILRVRILEAQPYEIGEEGAGSLYAAKDGVITRVVVEGGRAKVVAGDAVVRGQELIVDAVPEGAQQIVSQAKGEVIAQVLYSEAARAGPLLMLPQREGEARRDMRVSLFGYALGGAGEGREAVSLGAWRLTNCFLPVTFEAIESYALVESLGPATQEELEARAHRRAEAALLAKIPDNAIMLSKHSQTTLNEDGSLTVTLTVVTEENIAQRRGTDGHS